MACDLNQLYVYMEQSPGLMQIMLQLLSNTCNHLTAQLRRITLYDRYQRIASLLLSETAAPDYDRGITSSSILYPGGPGTDPESQPGNGKPGTQ